MYGSGSVLGSLAAAGISAGVLATDVGDYGYFDTAGYSNGTVVDETTQSDTVNGGEGNDTAYGSRGDDILNGDAGSDTLNGDVGSDVINGGFGTDRIYGNLGNDTLYENQENDYVHGGQGNDAIYGGQNDDELHGGAGVDTICGNLGADKLFGESEPDFLYGDDGDDQLNGGDGSDLLYGGGGSDIIVAGDNVASGELNREIADGGNGNDRILVQGDVYGAMIEVTGGAGNDIIDVRTLFAQPETSEGVVIRFGVGDGHDEIVTPSSPDYGFNRLDMTSLSLRDVRYVWDGHATGETDDGWQVWKGDMALVVKQSGDSIFFRGVFGRVRPSQAPGRYISELYYPGAVLADGQVILNGDGGYKNVDFDLGSVAAYDPTKIGVVASNVVHSRNTMDIKIPLFGAVDFRSEAFRDPFLAGSCRLTIGTAATAMRILLEARQIETSRSPGKPVTGSR